MMMMDTRYYLASGESERQVREFFDKRKVALVEVEALGKEFGGEPIGNGRTLVGFTFGECPEGWRKAGWTPNGGTYYMPLRRSKAGKALSDRIKSVRIPDASEIHSLFSTDGGVWGDMSPRGGFKIHYITAEICGGQVVIHVPEKSDVEPPDSKPLKKSEYWALKETASAGRTALEQDNAR